MTMSKSELLASLEVFETDTAPTPEQRATAVERCVTWNCECVEQLDRLIASTAELLESTVPRLRTLHVTTAQREALRVTAQTLSGLAASLRQARPALDDFTQGIRLLGELSKPSA
jgi:hypothetical protein